jgi:hypothetical protein
MKNALAVLAAIAWVYTGLFSSTIKVQDGAGVSGFQPDPTPTPQAQLAGQKIGVTETGYDDTGPLIDSIGWTYTEIQNAQLSDYELIKQFDVIFINCSELADTYAEGASTSLEQFVREGGTLYSSDWAFVYIDKAFPGYIEFFEDPFSGAGSQAVTADIIDPGLRQYLKSSTLNIQFELDYWVPIENVSDAVRVYVSGDFDTYNGVKITDKPLSVSFSYGEGRVLYTAYHNEPQAVEVTPEQKELLNYLVLVSTTEELSAGLHDSLTAQGYTVQEEILHTIGPGETSARYTIANETISNLAIGLNWKEGALRLSVFKPDGSLYVQEDGTPQLIVEVPNAEAGNWSYEVYGQDVPYGNYPYVVQLGTAEVVEVATVEPPAEDTGPLDQRAILFLVVGCVLCSIVLIVIALVVVFFVLKKRRA